VSAPNGRLKERRLEIKVRLRLALARGDIRRDPPRLVFGEQFDGGLGFLNVPIS